MPLGGLAALSSARRIVRSPGPRAEARAVELERRGEHERGRVHARRAAAQDERREREEEHGAERVGVLGQRSARRRPTRSATASTTSGIRGRRVTAGERPDEHGGQVDQAVARAARTPARCAAGRCRGRAAARPSTRAASPARRASRPGPGRRAARAARARSAAARSQRRSAAAGRCPPPSSSARPEREPADDDRRDDERPAAPCFRDFCHGSHGEVSQALIERPA